MLGCQRYAVSAKLRGYVTTTHEEAIDSGVRRVSAATSGGGVVESGRARGVGLGQKGEKKGLEVELVGAIGSERASCCTVVENMIIV